MKSSFLFLTFLALISTACSASFAPHDPFSSSTSASNGTQIPDGSTPGALQLQLTWKANAGEQQGFYIEQSVDGTNFSQVNQVADGTLSATVNVLPGKKYYFRIRGYNPAGDSSYSQVVMGGI